MEERFCLNCGTEVDADARFCPVCGQRIDLPPPAAEEAPVPPPDPDPATPTPAPEGPQPEPAPGPQPEPEPEPPAAAPAALPAADEPPAPATPEVARGADLPFTWPTMLSGWLIGGGSLLAAIGIAPSMGRAVSVILFVALLWVGGSVFLADRFPDVPHERLVIMAIAFIGLGMALDRTGFDVRGWDTTFLIGMLAAAGGVLLVELDRDRPMPPPDRPSS